MRNPGGYATIVSPTPGRVVLDGMRCQEVGEGLVEFDTFTCVHCNRGVHAPVRARDTDYYFCRNCMARICDPCADHPCIPFMKKIEAQEERSRRLQLMLRG